MLLKQTLQYMPAQLMGPAIQLGSLLVWAHLLPPGEVGKATLVVAMQEVAFAGLFMWWSHFMLRYWPRYAGGSGRAAFIRAETAALVGSTLVQLFVVALVARYYFGAQPSGFFILSVTAFVSIRSLSIYMTERARAGSHILLYTGLQAIFPALGLLLSLLAILQGTATAEHVLLAVAIPQALGVALAMAWVGIGRGSGVPDKAVLRSAAAFGLPVAIGALLTAMALNAPRFLVDQTLGIATAGIFAVGYGLGMRASSVAVMLVTAAAYPLAVRRMENEGPDAASAQLARNMTLVALVVLPVACGLVGLTVSAVDILLPAGMREASYVVLPLSVLCGLFRSLRSHTTDQVFLIWAQPHYVTMIAAADLALTVVLAAAGLTHFGLWGAVLGPLVAAVLSWAASLFIAAIGFGFPFPAWKMARIAIAAVAMMLTVLSLPATASPVGMGIQVIVGALVYFAALAALFPSVAGSRFRVVLRGTA